MGIKYSYKANDLFRPGNNSNLNACVGRNGGPYGFIDYAYAYFDAGNALAVSCIDSGFFEDRAIYPMAYCFRHAVELALKHLTRLLPRIYSDSGEPEPTHKLM